MLSGFQRLDLPADIWCLVRGTSPGRYVILLMSIFSIYTGLMYNEAFSIPLSVFGGSQFHCPSDPSLSIMEVKTNPESCPEAYTKGLSFSGTPYPLGVDPIWHGTKSELPYLNSLKMKMSILLGEQSLRCVLLGTLVGGHHSTMCFSC